MVGGDKVCVAWGRELEVYSEDNGKPLETFQQRKGLISVVKIHSSYLCSGLCRTQE